MSMPIVFVHINNRDYLIYSLLQAKHSNPHSKIFLLGNSSNNCYKFVEHRHVSDYDYNAKEFAKIYRHYHTINPYQNELFCFQRWFIIRDFMVGNNLEKCLCLDSVVMLYANLTEEEKKFAEFDLTLSREFSPHCVFVNSLIALKNFCRFVVKLYTNSSLLKSLEQTLQECIQNKVYGGVSDMTVFNVFKETKECHIGEISTIIDGSIYDHNMNFSEGFEMCNGVKKIYFLEGQPFGKHISSDQDIKFNALHFQGKAKKLMKTYFTGKLILDETSIIVPFKLGKINLIIFPDWATSEESLCRELEQVIGAIATHPERSHMTLLVGTDNITDEDANLVLSSVTLNLLMQDDLDVTEVPEISLVGKLEEIQWEVLLPRLHARIVLEKENQQAIAAVKADTIPVWKLDSPLPKG
jgi:hypothetical protein